MENLIQIINNKDDFELALISQQTKKEVRPFSERVDYCQKSFFAVIRIQANPDLSHHSFILEKGTELAIIAQPSFFPRDSSKKNGLPRHRSGDPPPSHYQINDETVGITLSLPNLRDSPTKR